MIDRIVGSHHILKYPGDPTRTVAVPCHSGRDLKPGTIRGIIRQAGLSVEEFDRLDADRNEQLERRDLGHAVPYWFGK